MSMIDPQKNFYATGRRKEAVARVWIQPGSGKISMNGPWRATSVARLRAWSSARRSS